MSRADAVEPDVRGAAEPKLAAAKAVLADREKELLELQGPCSTKDCRLHRAHSGPCDPVVYKELSWGDRVVVSCSATGRYLGKFRGVELALFVSAMDNSVNIDIVDRRREPHKDLPIPTARELEAATNGLRKGVELMTREATVG